MLPKVLIALLIPAYWVCVTAPAAGFYHDDGIYLATAKALATGHGYRILILPSELPQTKYPPVYPAILALIWKVWGEFPRNLVLLKSVSVVFTILWLWAVLMFLREFTGFGKHAWWLILFTLVSPWVIFLSGLTMPDTMFAFLSLYGVLLLTRAVEGRVRRPLLTVALAAMFASAAFLTRTAGIALIAAALFVLLLRRMPRGAAVFALVCGLFCSPWLLWQAAHPGPLDLVQSYYTKLNYGSGANIFQGFSLPQALTIAKLNFLHIYLSFWMTAGFPFLPIMFVLSLPLWIFVLVGALRRGNPAWMPLRLWVLVYAGMLICYVYPPYRYIVPIFPILLMFGLDGFRQVLGKSLHLRGVRLAALCVVLILIAYLGRQAALAAAATLRTGTASVGLGARDDWKPIVEMMNWIRDNTASNAVIAADSDPAIYLYTGRKAIHFSNRPYWTYYLDDDRDMRAPLERLKAHLRDNKINYVMMTPMRMSAESDYFHQLLSAALHSDSGVFRLVHQLPEPGYRIYAVDPAYEVTDSRARP